MEKIFLFLVRCGGNHGDEVHPQRITPATQLMLDMISVFEYSSLGYVKRFSSRDHGIALYHVEIFKLYALRESDSSLMCFFRWDPDNKKLGLEWRPAACNAAGIVFPPALLEGALRLEP